MIYIMCEHMFMGVWSYMLPNSNLFFLLIILTIHVTWVCSSIHINDMWITVVCVSPHCVSMFWHNRLDNIGIVTCAYNGMLKKNDFISLCLPITCPDPEPF